MAGRLAAGSLRRAAELRLAVVSLRQAEARPAVGPLRRAVAARLAAVSLRLAEEARLAEEV